jgi:hypothetical protein
MWGAMVWKNSTLLPEYNFSYYEGMGNFEIQWDKECKVTGFKISGYRVLNLCLVKD